VSFLVPAKYAARLRTQTLAPAYRRPASFLDLLDAQLLQNQAELIERLLGDPLKQVSLGEYRLPGELSRFFKCWGSTDREEGRPYDIVNHQCSTQDQIYVADHLFSGAIHIEHSLITSEQLNALQFFSLYEDQFKRCPCGLGGLGGGREHVGRFVCTTDFVGQGHATYKAVLCLRAYKQLPGLYDAVFKAASLNSTHSGVQTTLTLSGVSYESAMLFGRRYLEAIAWKK
jgi:serine protease Do